MKPGRSPDRQHDGTLWRWKAGPGTGYSGLDASLSCESCSFKIAFVNQVRFSVQFVAAISQGFRTCMKLDAILLRKNFIELPRQKSPV